MPVGAAETCAALKRVADDCICATTPEPFYGVGDWYLDFTQTTDDEVRALLQDADRPPYGAAQGGASRRAW